MSRTSLTPTPGIPSSVEVRGFESLTSHYEGGTVCGHGAVMTEKGPLAVPSERASDLRFY